ncbi:MAG TPA: DUF1883 domain-containing protein [Bryobacteraceae bacterium]|nr:DUF1883 domain-containing protein [Bryobacteraceae bacterium]
MADFIHAREHLQKGDIVVVESSHQCNVCLTTDAEFSKYKSGRKFRHYGGFARIFPARIVVPHAANWNITLDLGGGRANIQYSISYIKQP